MVAVKPMMQQPSGAKPNSSYNNNNGRTAAPSMKREQSITQVCQRKINYTYVGQGLIVVTRDIQFFK